MGIFSMLPFVVYPVSFCGHCLVATEKKKKQTNVNFFCKLYEFKRSSKRVLQTCLYAGNATKKYINIIPLKAGFPKSRLEWVTDCNR